MWSRRSLSSRAISRLFLSSPTGCATAATHSFSSTSLFIDSSGNDQLPTPPFVPSPLSTQFPSPLSIGSTRWFSSNSRPFKKGRGGGKGKKEGRQGREGENDVIPKKDASQPTRYSNPNEYRTSRSASQATENFESLPPLPTEPETVYEESEKVPGKDMLLRIVSDLKAKGKTYILPLNDHEAVWMMTKAFRDLISIGVHPEFLMSACVVRPEMFSSMTTRPDDVLRMLHMLVDCCAMSYEDSIRMFASYAEELMLCECEGVQQRLDALIASGANAGKLLGTAVRLCPALLFAREPEDVRRAAEALVDFFSRKEISAIIQRCPQVLLMNVDEIEQKYEYIYYQMCIEGVEFTRSSRWALLPLQDIMMRHEFLMKCGRYTTPDAKHPQSKMENPELHRILDSSDDHFAVQVAKVSREEWIVYRALAAKWAGLTDRDRPFERVKPSLRKAFERRRKETAEIGEHVFDVSARAD